MDVTQSPYMRGQQWMGAINFDAPFNNHELNMYISNLKHTALNFGPVHIELDYYDFFNLISDKGEVYPIDLLKKQLRSIPHVYIIDYRSADGSYALESGLIIKNGWK